MPERISGRVLIVEDDFYALQNCIDELELLGIDVTLVGSPSEALRCLEASHFDFVILDIMMPFGDWKMGAQTHDGLRTGVVLAKHIRALYPSLKVAAHSNVNNEAVETSPLFDAYWQKGHYLSFGPLRQ